ncbi:Rieske 2Fe-2S domain-containing protein [Pseudonocardia kujensis]|uniref:glutamate synthase-related protein n=1 Tax=Pseudonocardia kujensis TaxID=1128675 RepID=UPI001E522A77|nr:glutamate synthase-related protein [Pseudonocardia kujensis]MCE0767517.1 Rieske 2Fe-2S domain-containing protein [Pseudonocardia kujensis]
MDTETATGTNLLPILRWDGLAEDRPVHAEADGIDLVVVRRNGQAHVFEGRCPHRGALLADGRVEGGNLVCGVHGWDYRLDTGVSAYNPAERLSKFTCHVVDDEVLVDKAELADYRARRPERRVASTYDRLFDDPHQDTPEEPYVGEIHRLARNGLSGVHGQVAAMGVPRPELPSWDDLQVLTAQLHRFPMLDHEPVDTAVTIGPAAARPLRLEIPVFVSDMSFGAISAEAKTALARGAEGAGTAICSGEGGMLPEEQAECSRYLYELASGRFGWDEACLDQVQALHLKLGQGAKTGTGGHLPGHKVVGRIAEVRGLPEGTAAVSPARFTDWTTLLDARAVVDRVRERSGGIPVGVKMSAQHVEADLDAALDLGVDYVILDGRGGGTGAAPTIFRDTISVPTMAALARARRHLDLAGARDVTLVATGGFRRAQDMVKALALGADAIAVSNVALQAIGCVGMRACHTDNCPMGIATQKPHLRARLPVQRAAEQLTRYLDALTELMVVLARACGHDSLSHFTPKDLTSWKRDVAELVGVHYAGVTR